jgi:hypothetical protein
MARKNQHSFSKRQREMKKAEKAAQKRAKRLAPEETQTPNAVIPAESADTPETAEDSSPVEDGGSTTPQ